MGAKFQESAEAGIIDQINVLFQHHRTPPGPAFAAPRFLRMKPWPPLAKPCQIPQPHLPKWHALVPRVPQWFEKDRQ